MPQLNIDVLDDPLVYDTQTDFKGGMVSNERANRLDQTQAALLVNCDFTRFGKLITRKGTVQLGGNVGSNGTYMQGLINFEAPPSFNYLIAMSKGKLYKYDGISSWTQIGSYSSSQVAAPFSYAMLIDKLYFADAATGNLQSWDGTTIVDQGNGTPSSNPTNPPAGIGFMVSFAGRIMATGVAAFPDTVYFSNFLSADGGQWNQITQAVRIGEGEGDPVQGLAQWLQFNLIVFKRNSIYLIDCNPQDATTGDIDLLVANYQIRPIHKKLGCLAPRTAAQVGGDMFFLASDRSVRSIKKLDTAEESTWVYIDESIEEAVSFPIQDYLDRINLSVINLSSATFRDFKYILTVPLDNSLVPNYTFVYNTITKSWAGYWTGWTATCFAQRVPNATGPSRMVFGDSTSNVFEFQDYVTPSNEVTQTFQDGNFSFFYDILSRAFAFGELNSYKTGFKGECEFESSLSSPVIAYRKDANTLSNNIGTAMSALAPSIKLPFILPVTLPAVGVVLAQFDLQSIGQLRELQIELTGTGKISLRSIMISGWQDSYVSRTSPTTDAPFPINT